MDFPWKVGVLYTAHKVLNTCVVILLPSYNDAYGPQLLSCCHHAMMQMDHRCCLIAIIQRCIWAPLAAIENLGQFSNS